MSGWSALAGAAMDFANSGLGLYQSSKAFRQAKEMYQNRYQWAVDDLRKAGLNPILAATGGGVSVSGGGSGTQVPAGTLGSALSKSSAASLAREQIKTQEKQQELLWNQSVQAFNNAQYLGALKDQAKEQTRSIGMANEVMKEQVDYMREHPNARDFGNFFQLINPFNAFGNSARALIK